MSTPTFDELWTAIATAVLPSPAVVEAFHYRLKSYSERPDAVFVVRQVTGLERRDLVTAKGGLIRPSDNSPAWCVHAMLRDEHVPSDDQMVELMRTVPTHLFDVKGFGRRTANADGLYVAHIYPAKNRDTAWRGWSREELVRRFVRNVHPCNLFFVPIADRQLGEDPAVIAAMAERMAQRYAAVWGEFLSLAEATALPSVGTPIFSRPLHAVPPGTPSANEGVPKYSSHRLDFHRDVIEPLGCDQAFEIQTPHGRFRFTKQQFYEAFPNVVASVSYKKRGRYHYARLPLKAMAFLVGSE